MSKQIGDLVLLFSYIAIYNDYVTIRKFENYEMWCGTVEKM